MVYLFYTTLVSVDLAQCKTFNVRGINIIGTRLCVCLHLGEDKWLNRCFDNVCETWENSFFCQSSILNTFRHVNPVMAE